MNEGNVMSNGGTPGHSRRGSNKLGGRCVKSILPGDIYITRMMTGLVLELQGARG